MKTGRGRVSPADVTGKRMALALEEELERPSKWHDMLGCGVERKRCVCVCVAASLASHRTSFEAVASTVARPRASRNEAGGSAWGCFSVVIGL